jgi:hypothetical protein
VLIKKAWETRDAAVKRKNNTEIELARTRIDVMQVTGLASHFILIFLQLYLIVLLVLPLLPPAALLAGEQPADGGDPAEG